MPNTGGGLRREKSASSHSAQLRLYRNRQLFVVASPQNLDMDDFVKTIKAQEGRDHLHVMLKTATAILKERPSVILTDDYVPVDNFIAHL